MSFTGSVKGMQWAVLVVLHRQSPPTQYDIQNLAPVGARHEIVFTSTKERGVSLGLHVHKKWLRRIQRSQRNGVRRNALQMQVMEI